MITFKQKEFLAPLIPALVGAAGSVVGAGIGNKGAKAQAEAQERAAIIQATQAKKQQKAQEEEAKKDRELQEKQLKAAQKQERDLIRLAKRNPAAAAAVKPTATVTATVGGTQPQEATFSIPIGAALETVSSVAPAALGVVQAKMQTNAVKAETKGNIATANASLNAAKQDSKARIAAARYNSKVQRQELRKDSKAFKTNAKLALKQIKNSPVNSATSITQVQQQKAYSNSNTKNEIAGFAKNIKQLAANRGVKKSIMATAVGGATVVGARYLVDKAIQRDIKKSGLEKVNEETPEQVAARKKARKRALLIGLGTTAATVGAGIAAKKGAFGTNAKNWANTNLTKSNFKTKAIGAKNSIKNGFLDAYTTVDPDTGKRKVNTLGVGMTAAGIAVPAVKYALTKRAYKKQIEQSRDERPSSPEDRTYSKVSAPKVGSAGGGKLGQMLSGFLKKKGTGTTAPKTSSVNKSQNSKGYVDFRRRITHWKSGLKNNNPSSASSSSSEGGLFSGFKAGFQEFKKAPGQFVLGKISEREGGGGRKGVAKFGADLEQLGKKNKNNLSQKAGKFIKENPKTALVGSIGVGLGVAKLGGMGEKAATKALKTVDKNAFAYEERGTTFAPKGKPVNKRQIEQEQEEYEGEN